VLERQRVVARINQSTSTCVLELRLPFTVIRVLLAAYSRLRSFKFAKVRLDLAIPADLLPVFWTFHCWESPVCGMSDSGRWTGKVHEVIEVHGSADCFIMRQREGTAIGAVCRKAGISEATFSN
jgi:hypothetical protein